MEIKKFTSFISEGSSSGSVDNPNSSSNKSLKKKSKSSGISLGILKKVFKRGKAAWNSGHRPGTPQNAWAMGRVNSFITGTGGARKADADLWKKAKESKRKKNEAFDGFDSKERESLKLKIYSIIMTQEAADQILKIEDIIDKVKLSKEKKREYLDFNYEAFKLIVIDVSKKLLMMSQAVLMGNLRINPIIYKRHESIFIEKIPSIIEKSKPIFYQDGIYQAYVKICEMLAEEISNLQFECMDEDYIDMN